MLTKALCSYWTPRRILIRFAVILAFMGIWWVLLEAIDRRLDEQLERDLNQLLDDQS